MDELETESSLAPEVCAAAPCEAPSMLAAPMAAKSLDEAMAQIDESFSEMLLRKIDERGLTDA